MQNRTVYTCSDWLRPRPMLLSCDAMRSPGARAALRTDPPAVQTGPRNSEQEILSGSCVCGGRSHRMFAAGSSSPLWIAGGGDGDVMASTIPRASNLPPSARCALERAGSTFSVRCPRTVQYRGWVCEGAGCSLPSVVRNTTQLNTLIPRSLQLAQQHRRRRGWPVRML